MFSWSATPKQRVRSVGQSVYDVRAKEEAMPITPQPIPTPGPPVNAASTDNKTPAVQGTSLAGIGPFPGFGSATGVIGGSGSGVGVQGTSESGIGVVGVSQTQDAINGTSSASSAQGHAGVSANNNNGGYALWAKATGAKPGTGGIAGYFNSDGNVAVQVDGKMQVNGDHHCTGTITVDKDVQLTGADFAEDFQVEASESIEPGMVMVLDENGVLRPSDQSYDRKVAGVISGAGDYRPGLILDRHKSSEGRLPLALVGKVYCKVDAAYGAIEVGDLLTTSPTPGHAMRASDPLKAFGAVVGKALRPLHVGEGLIPILVTLQ
jgi:hypothetical protein